MTYNHKENNKTINGENPPLVTDELDHFVTSEQPVTSGHVAFKITHTILA
jgi:hypothetical protein